MTRQAESLGSGFLISADGYIVTNNHVITAGSPRRGGRIDHRHADRPQGIYRKLIGRDRSRTSPCSRSTPPTCPS
jgi:serine protease Do